MLLFDSLLTALEDEAVEVLAVSLEGLFVFVLLRRLNVAANSDNSSLWPGVVLLTVFALLPEPEPIDAVSLLEFEEIRFGAKKYTNSWTH